MDEIKSLTDKLKDNPAGLIHELVATTNKAMAPKYQRWQRYRRKLRNEWYINNQWNQRPLYSTNYLRSKVETVKAYISQQLPVPEVKGQERNDDIAAEVKNNVLQWALRMAKWEKKARELAHEAEVCGIAWIKPRLDPDAFNGQGIVVYDVIPSENVKVDPKATEPGNARWIIQHIPDVSVEEIEAFYGKKVIGSDKEDTKNDNRPDEQKASTPGQTCDVYEAYIRDYSMETAEEPVEQETEQGVVQVLAKVKRRKYPNWRMIVVAGNTVLADKPVDRLPLKPYWPTDETGNMYPPSIVEMAEPLQDLADAIDEQIYRNIRMTVKRQRIVSSATGLTRNMITDAAGEVYMVSGDIDKAMKWDEPTLLGQEIFAYRKEIEERISIVTGIFSVAQGKPEFNIQTYSTVAALQDASTSTIKMRLKLLAETAAEVAQETLALIKENFGPYREIKITGQGVYRIIDEYPAELQEATEEEKRAWMEQNGIDLVLSDIDELHDIVVQAENALPADRSARAQVSLKLMETPAEDGLPVITRKALLDALDYPKASELIREIEELKNQQTMQQQQEMLMQQQLINQPGIGGGLQV